MDPTHDQLWYSSCIVISWWCQFSSDRPGYYSRNYTRSGWVPKGLKPLRTGEGPAWVFMGKTARNCLSEFFLHQMTVPTPNRKCQKQWKRFVHNVHSICLEISKNRGQLTFPTPHIPYAECLPPSDLSGKLSESCWQSEDLVGCRLNNESEQSNNYIKA